MEYIRPSLTLYLWMNNLSPIIYDFWNGESYNGLTTVFFHQWPCKFIESIHAHYN